MAGTPSVSSRRGRSPIAAKDGLRAAAGKLTMWIGFAVIPAGWSALLARGWLRSGAYGFDFKGWYWPQAQRFLHGLSTYVQPYPHALYYPAPGLLALTPFGLLSRSVGTAVFGILMIATVPATLRLLRVRDWRLYGLAMMLQPVVSGWQTVNISLALVLGVAIAWRLRDRAIGVGLVVALLISIKLLFWPLAIWLLATRRTAACAWCAAFTLAVNLAAWAVVGFGEIPRYLRALGSFAVHAERVHYGIVALALQAGIGRPGGYALMLLAGLPALAACAVYGRRAADQRSFVWAIAATLLLSPVVEAHYLALLLVPLALGRPRLAAIWFAPLLLWLNPSQGPDLVQCIVALAVGAVMLLGALAPAERRAAIPPAKLLLSG
jgi:hypothetical protein